MPDTDFAYRLLITANIEDTNNAFTSPSQQVSWLPVSVAYSGNEVLAVFSEWEQTRLIHRVLDAYPQHHQPT